MAKKTKKQKQSDVVNDVLAEAEHVVHPGDKTRKATDEEKLAKEFDQSLAPNLTEEQINLRADQIISKILAIRASPRKWKELSHAARMALLGALYALQEVTGVQEGEVPISFARWLGVTFEGLPVGSS